MPLHKLDKATPFPRRNLDVCDLSKPLEKRAEFVLSDIPREPPNEYSCIVRVSKLIHRLRSTIISDRRSTHRIHSNRARHTSRSTACLIFGGRSGYAHRSVATINTLHLCQSSLLIHFVRKTNETVPSRHSAHRISHNLSGLARGKSRLKEWDKNIFIHFRSKVANKDWVFRTTVIPSDSLARQDTIETNKAIYLRSARPPPEAQLSLNGRVLFGIREPARVRALAAAAGDPKSTKQYPAFLTFVRVNFVKADCRWSKKFREPHTQKTCRESSSHWQFHPCCTRCYGRSSHQSKAQVHPSCEVVSTMYNHSILLNHSSP